MMLLIEALRLIRANTRGVVTRLLPAYALWFAVIVLVEAWYDAGGSARGDWAWVLELSVFAGIMVFGGALLAVIWHRIAMVPDASVTLARGYGRYLVAFTVIILLYAALLTVTNVLFMQLILSGTGFSVTGILLGDIVFPALITLLLPWAYLRVGLILPAAALSETGFSIRDSWSATRRWRGAILGFTLVTTLATAALTGIGGGHGALPVVVEGVGLGLLALIGLSALTWMYREATAP